MMALEEDETQRFKGGGGDGDERWQQRVLSFYSVSRRISYRFQVSYRSQEGRQPLQRTLVSHASRRFAPGPSREDTASR